MTIRIGTSERDGTFHSQGHALKAIFARRPADVLLLGEPSGVRTIAKK